MVHPHNGAAGGLISPECCRRGRGLVGFGRAIGGIAFGQLVGYLLDHGFGYGIVFTLAGTFHIIALLVILATIPVI